MKFLVILLSASLAVCHGARYHLIHHEYHGPAAPLAKDGRVLETEEVAKARANHLAIHAETLAAYMKRKEAEEAKKQEEGETMEEEEVEKKEEMVMEMEKPEMPMEMMMMAAPEMPMEMAMEMKKAEEAPKKVEMAPQEKMKMMLEALGIEKPIFEIQENDIEIKKKEPVKIYPQPKYEGPAAPLGKDGRVVDTAEVAEARAKHLKALEEAAKLTKALEAKKKESDEKKKKMEEAMAKAEEEPKKMEEEAKKEEEEAKKEEEEPKKVEEEKMEEEAEEKKEEEKKKEEEVKKEEPKVLAVPHHGEIRKIVYLSRPVHLVYAHESFEPAREAPLGKDGKVVDTPEVEQAKWIHNMAHEHAKAIASRHPPKPQDDNRL